MFEDVGVVAGVEGVAIAEHGGKRSTWHDPAGQAATPESALPSTRHGALRATGDPALIAQLHCACCAYANGLTAQISDIGTRAERWLRCRSSMATLRARAEAQLKFAAGQPI